MNRVAKIAAAAVLTALSLQAVALTQLEEVGELKNTSRMSVETRDLSSVFFGTEKLYIIEDYERGMLCYVVNDRSTSISCAPFDFDREE